MLKSGRSKTPTEICTGIEPDTPAIAVRFRLRRMAVDDDGVELPPVAEKLFADPQKVLLSLHIERHGRADAGMDKQVVANPNRQVQSAKEFEMLRWQCSVQRRACLFPV